MEDIKTEITVSGICVLSSAGETARALCERRTSEDIITPQIDLEKYERQIALFDTGPQELNRIQKLLFVAFLKASQMAGLELRSAPMEQAGIFFGNSYGIEEFKSGFFRMYKKSEPALTGPALFPFTTANALASWLAIQTGAKGPNLTFVNGAISSSEAVFAACDALINNECNIAFAGGISAINNDFRDEFYASGFRYESAGMIVLEKTVNAEGSKRKPLAFLKDRQRFMLTKGQMEKIKTDKSAIDINDEMRNRFKTASLEVVHLGNNLGEDIFNYNKDKFEITRITSGKRRIFSLSDAAGNFFDAAGLMGVALGIEFLHLFPEDVVCSNIDSNGSVATMLISRTL